MGDDTNQFPPDDQVIAILFPANHGQRVELRIWPLVSIRLGRLADPATGSCVALRNGLPIYVM